MSGDAELPRYELHWRDALGNVTPGGSSRHSCVYFVLDFSDGNIWLKTGHCRDLSARLNNLQVGNPRKLKLIGWIAGGHEEERKIHASLDEWWPESRVPYSEWFQITDEIVQLLRDVCTMQSERASESARKCREEAKRLGKLVSLEVVRRAKSGDLESALRLASTLPFEKQLETSVEIVKRNRLK